MPYRVYSTGMDAGSLIRERRRANGLTQSQLALRAGSTQAAISRLERGEISPTIETINRLLAVMGEEADIVVQRSGLECDGNRLRALRSRTPADRLTQAIAWNRLAAQVSIAGERARTKPS